MKRCMFFCFALACLMMLCACSTHEGSTETTNNIPATNGQISDPNDLEGSETTTPDILGDIEETEPTTPGILAEDYLETVHYISDEWMDDTYLVYGVDNSGNDCYGLLSVSGTIKPLTEYEAYYPLANGNFFVTNDTDVIRDFDYTDFDEYFKPLCSFGKIIDRNGNIVYEPDENGPYQKMYVINSETIFVLAVSSGFDGLDVYWGVLDSTGNWVHELDNTGVLVEKIKNNDLIELNSDGSWTYAHTEKSPVGYTEDGHFKYDHRAFYTQKCGSYDGKENDSLCFFLESNYDSESESCNCDLIIYQASTNRFVELCSFPLKELAFGGFHEPETFQQVSDNQWCQLYSYTYYAHSITRRTHMLYDTTGEASKINNYLLTLDGIKYWYNEGILYSDANPDGVAYPEYITEKLKSFITVHDDKAYMVVEGADGLSYLAVGDLQGNIVKEPFRPTNFGRIIGHGDDGLIAYQNKDVVYIYDLLKQDDEALIVTVSADECDSVKFLGNDLIAVIDNCDPEDEAEVINFNGQPIA